MEDLKGIIKAPNSKQKGIRNMSGIVEAKEPTDAVELKRKAQLGEY